MYCGRFCVVHLALAELCVACHQHGDCYAHIRLVGSVLDQKRRGRIVFAAKPKLDVATRSAHQTPKSSEGGDGDEEEETEFLHSCMTSLDYQTVTDPCGSPTTTEHTTVSLPPTWKHRHNCGCLLCSDTALERMWLRSYIIEAANRLLQDNVSESKTMLLTAMRQRERLLTNISTQISHMGLAVHDDGVRAKALKSLSAVAVYQTYFDVIALNLCEAAFLGKDLKHFSSRYSQAEKALKNNYLPSDWSHVHLAELFYIGATPSLLWPPTAQLVPKSKLSAVDILCAGIGRVTIADVVTPPKPTRKSQKAERVSSFIAGANDEQPSESQKSRRGRSNNSAVAAPVKSRPVAPKLSARSRNVIKEIVDDALSSTDSQTENINHVQKSSGTVS